MMRSEICGAARTDHGNGAKMDQPIRDENGIPSGAFTAPFASLPFFLTTDDVAGILRCGDFVGGSAEDAARRARAMARRWLQAHQVPCIRAGKHKIFRREAVLEALAAAEKSGKH